MLLGIVARHQNAVVGHVLVAVPIASLLRGSKSSKISCDVLKSASYHYVSPPAHILPPQKMSSLGFASVAECRSLTAEAMKYLMHAVNAVGIKER